MRQVVFNDYLGATLCGLFIAVMLAVVTYAIKAIASARRDVTAAGAPD